MTDNSLIYIYIFTGFKFTAFRLTFFFLRLKVSKFLVFYFIKFHVLSLHVELRDKLQLLIHPLLQLGHVVRPRVAPARPAPLHRVHVEGGDRQDDAAPAQRAHHGARTRAELGGVGVAAAAAAEEPHTGRQTLRI